MTQNFGFNMRLYFNMQKNYCCQTFNVIIKVNIKFYLPGWHWALCHVPLMEGCFSGLLTAPKPLRQNPLSLQGCETYSRSSSHMSPGPDIKGKRRELTAVVCCILQIKWKEHKTTLTVSASITSLKFLFPTILFFIALTASLGLQREEF